MPDGNRGISVDGLEETEYDHGVEASVKNAADAKLAFPALGYAVGTSDSCTIIIKSNGSGGMSLRVSNKGGLVHESDVDSGAVSQFLQKSELATGKALCDLSNRYRKFIYDQDDNNWSPEELPTYFAFEQKYPKASKLLKQSAVTLVLAKEGCTLEKQGAKPYAFVVSSLAEAFETLEVQSS